MTASNLNRESGALTPTHPLTTKDNGVSKMANKHNITTNLDSGIISKIIDYSSRYYAERVYTEIIETFNYEETCFESPIEEALCAAILAHNIDVDETNKLEIIFNRKEDKNIEKIKFFAKSSIFEAEYLKNKLEENNCADDVNQYFDMYDYVLMRHRLYNQIVIEDYRVDFLLVKYCYHAKKHKYLVIECDGHDFHERTKEQAKKDRAKDRKLQELGFTVFRFTGSEIWANPMACAEQIMMWG